jgi:hypothetical protein
MARAGKRLNRAKRSAGTVLEVLVVELDCRGGDLAAGSMGISIRPGMAGWRRRVLGRGYGWAVGEGTWSGQSEF